MAGVVELGAYDGSTHILLSEGVTNAVEVAYNNDYTAHRLSPSPEITDDLAIAESHKYLVRVSSLFLPLLAALINERCE